MSLEKMVTDITHETTLEIRKIDIQDQSWHGDEVNEFGFEFMIPSLSKLTEESLEKYGAYLCKRLYELRGVKLADELGL